ncbi:MAG: YIP1 family protein [Candidatus Margulisbacteria bacterium]|nr:YIP1 family protein [Candidatus Margulisiibacteriota bacterium]
MEIRNYFSTWWMVMLRPIYFYTKLKEADWKEQSLTFLLLTTWLLSFVATLVIFIVQYVPIGSTLVEGIEGLKFIIILPVLITLALVFFAITLLILGGLLTFAFFLMLYLIGILLNYVYLLLGGKGSLNRMIQSLFYSSAVILIGVAIFLLILLTKYAGLDYTLFRYGYNSIYYLLLLYMYGLWAVAGRKTYNVPKWKAFVGAAVPIIVMLIFGILFDKIALSRLQPWIT